MEHLNELNVNHAEVTKELPIAVRSVLNNLSIKSPEIEAETFGVGAHSTRVRARESCACASERGNHVMKD